MRDGIFPDELKIVKISPIYKKDNEELLENYRPVSTLAIAGKKFEKVIYNRLYEFIISQGMMHENLYGFRKSHSESLFLNYYVDYMVEYESLCLIKPIYYQFFCYSLKLVIVLWKL